MHLSIQFGKFGTVHLESDTPTPGLLLACKTAFKQLIIFEDPRGHTVQTRGRQHNHRLIRQLDNQRDKVVRVLERHAGKLRTRHYNRYVQRRLKGKKQRWKLHDWLADKEHSFMYVTGEDIQLIEELKGFEI